MSGLKVVIRMVLLAQLGLFMGIAFADDDEGEGEVVPPPAESESPPSTSCINVNTGIVILDNTATPSANAITSNLEFFDGCGKGSTTIGNGYGGNSINISNYHTLNRVTSTVPHGLELVIGADASNVDEQNFGTEDQLNYFREGEHLFELNRFRATADWLSGTGNITPDGGIVNGTYGTITLEQLIDNIVNDRTMYGIVRVIIGLEKGQRSACNNNCDKNSVGEIVPDVTDLYGFCDGTNTSGLCACAPGEGFNIKDGATICGRTIPSGAKIRVKGAMLWDFVDHITEQPIALAELPFAPRELYFKVTVPIMVNWSYDLDDDGAMDNMDEIRAVSNGRSAGVISSDPGINFSDIPQSSKDEYLFETGTVLDATVFATLNYPNRYHLLMASGYEDGWAEAFDKLNITGSIWNTLPKVGTCTNVAGQQCATFNVPTGITGVLTANNIRNAGFEDIPAYLYSGGLIDMHDHVNISGLVYVPQAMELEAKNTTTPTQQYIIGAVVIRDGFYIEANDNTTIVISSNPNIYSSARTNAASGTSSLVFDPGGPAHQSSNHSSQTNSDNNGGENSNSSGDSSCIGCSNNGGIGGGQSGLGATRWVEVRPQVVP